MSGMTLKQFAKRQYLDACQEYNRQLLAFSNGEPHNLVGASVLLHASKGCNGVPKRWWRASFVKSVGTGVEP